MINCGGGVTRTQAFSHWLKEFLLNVFMQSFHAVTYAVVVQAGITAFKGNGNWFFLIICTTFLFQGERILRKIFNLGSSFGTMKDLGETGLAAWGAARAITNSFHGKKATEEENSGSDNSSNSNDDTGSDSSSGQSTAAQGRIGVSTPGATQNINAIRMNPQLSGLAAAQKVVNQNANRVRNSRGRRLLSSATNVAGGLYGGMLASTASLAGGQDVKEAAVAGTLGYATGSSVIGGAIRRPIIGISNAFAGRRYKKAVLRGDFDKDFKDAGLDLSALDAQTADLIRQALAEQQSAAIRRGEKVGEYKFHKSINKNK